jgi:FeS assembly SUF system protein
MDAKSVPDAGAPAAGSDPEALERRVIEVLRTCYDPEIPVDIYELGLIYEVRVETPGKVAVRMTLTSPACPVAGSLPGEVESKVRGVEGVREAAVEVVWDPPWDKEMMSEAAKLKLGFF